MSAPAPKVRSLQDLDAIRRAIRQAEREAAAKEAERRAAEAAVARERQLFANSVGPVTPMKASGRHTVARPQPEPKPRQRELDDRAVLREALSDEIDVESLLDTDESLAYRRDGVGPDVVRRLRRGEWVVQAHIDLHGMRRDEAREALASFIRDAVKHGLRCVRVVHGKGHGSPGRQSVLKQKVRGWLVQKAEVMAFVQARGSEGGAGALIVMLRPSGGG